MTSVEVEGRSISQQGTVVGRRRIVFLQNEEHRPDGRQAVREVQDVGVPVETEHGVAVEAARDKKRPPGGVCLNEVVGVG